MAKHKIILFGDEARKKLLAGAEFLATPVRMTLGPFGQNFLLEKGNKVTNDGATVAAEIMHKDEIIQRGITATREATMRTNDEVGDGTTTATILVHEILQVASRQMKTEGTAMGKFTPATLLEKLAEESKLVIEKLEGMATPINTEAKLIEAAKVSVEDETLAGLIGKMQWELGKEGVIMPEETIDDASSIERVDGIRIDNGFSAYYVVTNPEDESLDVRDASIILTNHTLTGLKPILPVMEILAKMGVRKLVIVARAFSEQAIVDAKKNIDTGFNVIPINAPYVDQREVMKDIAAVVGATYLDQEAGAIETLQPSHVGKVARLVAKRNSAQVVGPGTKDTKTAIAERIKELEKKLKGVLSPFERRHVSGRLAQLKNGFAVLKVGAISTLERKRLYDKAEDACHAIRAAYQEGVVPGAGQAFKTISDDLPDDALLKAPLRSIYDQIVSGAPKGFKIPKWVQDPVKVLRVALQNAVSIAGTLATAAGASATENDKPRFVQEVDNGGDDDED